MSLKPPKRVPTNNWKLMFLICYFYQIMKMVYAIYPEFKQTTKNLIKTSKIIGKCARSLIATVSHVIIFS